MRGCIRGCRFCQAGYTYRPVRPPLAGDCCAVRPLKSSGKLRLSGDHAFQSLSTSDYPRPCRSCADAMLDYCAPRQDQCSALPSLRADNFSMALMERLQKVQQERPHVRARGGHAAPARRHQQESDGEEICSNPAAVAFAGGYSAVKLYFMLGLPTETDEDVLGIAEHRGS